MGTRWEKGGWTYGMDPEGVMSEGGGGMLMKVGALEAAMMRMSMRM